MCNCHLVLNISVLFTLSVGVVCLFCVVNNVCDTTWPFRLVSFCEKERIATVEPSADLSQLTYTSFHRCNAETKM